MHYPRGLPRLPPQDRERPQEASQRVLVHSDTLGPIVIEIQQSSDCSLGSQQQAHPDWDVQFADAAIRHTGSLSCSSGSGIYHALAELAFRHLQCLPCAIQARSEVCFPSSRSAEESSGRPGTPLPGFPEEGRRTCRDGTKWPSPAVHSNALTLSIHKKV